MPKQLRKNLYNLKCSFSSESLSTIENIVTANTPSSIPLKAIREIAIQEWIFPDPNYRYKIDKQGDQDERTKILDMYGVIFLASLRFIDTKYAVTIARAALQIKQHY